MCEDAKENRKDPNKDTGRSEEHTALFYLWLFIAGRSRLKPAEFFHSSARQKFSAFDTAAFWENIYFSLAVIAWLPSHHRVSPSHQLYRSSTPLGEEAKRRGPVQEEEMRLCCSLTVQVCCC